MGVIPGEHLWRIGEVAALFRVCPETVTHWCESKLLASTRTPGGHRRISDASVQTLLRGHQASKTPGNKDSPAVVPAELPDINASRKDN